MTLTIFVKQAHFCRGCYDPLAIRGAPPPQPRGVLAILRPPYHFVTGQSISTVTFKPLVNCS